MAGGGDVALPQVAVLGAMRCGTNLTKQMLETHWEVSASFSPFGWKHAGLPVLSPGSEITYPDMPIIYLVKNPYAFVLSLYRYRMLALTKGDRVSVEGADKLDDFLRQRLVIFDSQLPHSPRMRFSNPMQYWNYIYWNLETIERSRFRIRGLNYEVLINRPASLLVVEEIADLRRRKASIQLPRGHMGRLTETNIESEKRPETAFDTSYYFESRYLRDFTAEQLHVISSEVDPWLMERRGYRTI